MSDFYHFLGENPKFQPLVQSIIVSPADFSPFPLVKFLPRLSTLVLISGEYKKYYDSRQRPATELHSTILSCYHLFGKHIRTLSIDRLSFATPCDVLRLVLAFPRITKIVCHDLIIKSQANDTSAMEVIKRKLSKQLRLEVLNVRFYPGCIMVSPTNFNRLMTHTSQIHGGVDERVAEPLLNSWPSTVQTLIWTIQGGE